jgi:hypothetical protein
MFHPKLGLEQVLQQVPQWVRGQQDYHNVKEDQIVEYLWYCGCGLLS